MLWRRCAFFLGVVFLAARAWAGDIYIGAASFSYIGDAGSCTPAVRGTSNQHYTVASCAAGKSFLIYAAVPSTAAVDTTMKPEVTWEALSTQAGYVCWHARFLAIPLTSTTANASGIGNLSFTGAATSAPIAGQPNQYAPNLTGGGQEDATDMTTVAVYNRAQGAACTSGLPSCVNAPLVVQITRAATGETFGECTTSPLTANADAIMVHLVYNQE